VRRFDKPAHHKSLVCSGNIFTKDVQICMAIAGKRICAVLEHLNLMACSSLPCFAERDLNNTARILVQDVSNVFRVIEQQGFDISPPS